MNSTAIWNDQDITVHRASLPESTVVIRTPSDEVWILDQQLTIGRSQWSRKTERGNFGSIALVVVIASWWCSWTSMHWHLFPARSSDCHRVNSLVATEWNMAPHATQHTRRPTPLLFLWLVREGGKGVGFWNDISKIDRGISNKFSKTFPAKKVPRYEKNRAHPKVVPFLRPQFKINLGAKIADRSRTHTVRAGKRVEFESS